MSLGVAANTEQAALSSLAEAKLRNSSLAAVGEQLQGKIAMHNVLLQCLSDGGCLAQLHPATLRWGLHRVPGRQAGRLDGSLQKLAAKACFIPTGGCSNDTKRTIDCRSPYCWLYATDTLASVLVAQLVAKPLYQRLECKAW